MHIDPPRPPALTAEAVKHLQDVLAAEQAYAESTGRNAREDTELLGFLEGMEDELRLTPVETLVALSNEGFRLYGDHKREEYYYDATRDYVNDAVDEAGLKGRWCIVCWSYEREHAGHPCGDHNTHVYKMPECQNVSAAGRRRTDGA